MGEIAKETLEKGREYYLRLVEEARELLSNLDRHNPESIALALRRRQHLVDLLRPLRQGAAPETGEGQEDFAKLREQVTGQILEMDALVIALAREKQKAIKARLSSLSKSLNARHAYDAGVKGGRRSIVDDSA